MTVHLG